MTEKLDYSQVRPENKWKILRSQGRFILWAIYSALGVIMAGFDSTSAGLFLAMPAFQQQFGIPYPSQPSGYLIPAIWQSAWNGALYGGDGFGCLLAGFLMNRIGRKNMIYVSCVFNVVGLGMMQASTEWKLFLGGRLINAMGFASAMIFSPVWFTSKDSH